ncbi:MAG: hypothetical protein AABZ23_00390 [Deltaproteobacteria bacterium]
MLTIGQNLKRSFAILITCSILLSGCAGHTPNPVSNYQYGDEKKSCTRLRAELSEIQNSMATKAAAVSGTKTTNALVGGAGNLLFWPALFALDLSGADKIELEAYKTRHNTLLWIAAEKECGFDDKEILPEPPTPAKITTEETPS